MQRSNRLGDQLPQQVVVVRALRGLGDLLCAVPALRALRLGLPDTRITLLGLPWAEAFVRRFNCYVDDFIEFPGYPGIPERPVQVGELPSFFARMHGMRFDLAIQLHGSGTTSNAFTVMLGAQHTAGFYLPGQYCPDPERFLVYPEGEPEVRRHLKLVEFLGLPLHGEHMEFPVTAEDRGQLALTLARLPGAAHLAQGSYVCIHPGAHDPIRRWAPEQFAQVADGLAAEGLKVVLTGTEGEAELTHAVASAMRAPAINLAGRTSLGALAALLQGACLLVSNDTGVSHLAAALQVPSVVIFLASDPARWAPLNSRLHRRLGWPGAIALWGSALRQAQGPIPSTSSGTGSGSGTVLPLATPRRVLAEARSLLGAFTETVHAA